jgi:predicted TIM-barrel fold metal-dependent hydrolase
MSRKARIHRRDFLGRTILTGLALSAGTCGAGGAAGEKGAKVSASETEYPPIVDTHQHLWDLGRFRLPWLAGAGAINRSFVMKDYLEATAGLNVLKTVYMEVDVEPGQQVEEAEYVIDQCRRPDNPMAAAVISGRPAAPEFKAYITRFKDSPSIKGVRQVLHGGTPPGYCLTPEFIGGIRLLGELGMRFDICIRPGEISDAVKLVDACPDTRFILDHCGNPDTQAPDRGPWERDIASLAERKNIVCKVSGIIAGTKPGRSKVEQLQPFIRHVIAAFGPDRVMFGGDWPVCLLGATYREWVETLREIVKDRKPEEQRKLFHDNAVRFYGLS